MPKFMFMIGCLLLAGCIETAQTSNNVNNVNNVNNTNNNTNTNNCNAADDLCGGVCVSLIRDVKHCGDCRNACGDQPGAVADCEEGSCVYRCLPGKADNDQNLGVDGSNGCEDNCMPNDNPEDCNGLDDNCNGEIDEGVTTTFFNDGDGDGYGDPETAFEACTPPTDATDTGGDCDDQMSSIHPTAPEICDSLDNDCDGLYDEDLPGIECLGVCSLDPPLTCSDVTAEDYRNGICSGSPADLYERIETSCGDGEDNDCDGFTDCRDADCAGRAPDCAHEVLFIINSSFKGGDVYRFAGADNRCQIDARVAGWDPAITWKAILSDGTISAADRIDESKEVRDPTGEIIASGGLLFTEDLLNPPNVRANSMILDDATSKAWTGTNADGSAGVGHCDGWKENLDTMQVKVGDPHSRSEWLDGPVDQLPMPCDIPRRFYCISQPTF